MSRSFPSNCSPSLALIQHYLELGGLFNPEMMEHDKVRDMVMLCQDEIKRLRSELENIAKAKPSEWGEMSDQFQAWAQNRARHALANDQRRATAHPKTTP